MNDIEASDILDTLIDKLLDRIVKLAGVHNDLALAREANAILRKQLAEAKAATDPALVRPPSLVRDITGMLGLPGNASDTAICDAIQRDAKELMELRKRNTLLRTEAEAWKKEFENLNAKPEAPAPRARKARKAP